MGILGAGFGLYGYLPALIMGCRASVVLPLRYRKTVETREDVREFAEAIEWVEDDNEVMKRGEALILCRRPQDQSGAVNKVISYPQIKRILLEKPVAPSPCQAEAVLHLLSDRAFHVRIGYTFCYTGWARKLSDALKAMEPGAELHISWMFCAHHYAAKLHNWKRSVSSGGGALRFYGIHLVALLAKFGYDDAVSSSTFGAAGDDAQTWEAVLVGGGLPRCRIQVMSNTTSSLFSIECAMVDGFDIRLCDPFDEAVTVGKFDRRVSILTELCRDLIQSKPASYPWYNASIALWKRIEARNTQTVCSKGTCL